MGLMLEDFVGLLLMWCGHMWCYIAYLWQAQPAITTCPGIIAYIY